MPIIPEGKRISQYDLASTLDGTEFYPVVQSGITKRVAGSTIQQSFDQSCKCTLVSRWETVATDGNTISKYLQTYTLDSATLVNNGDRIEVKAFGYFSSATSKKLTLYFGSTSYTTGFMSMNGTAKVWELTATVVRASNTEQKTSFTCVVKEEQPSDSPQFYPAGQVLTASETLSTDIQIGVIGQNGTANPGDIVIEYFGIDLHKIDPDS